MEKIVLLKMTKTRAIAGMTGGQIGAKIREVARLRNLQAGRHSHSIGYYKAADAIEKAVGRKRIKSADELRHVKFVGPSTLALVDELLTEGAISQVENKREFLSRGHRESSYGAVPYVRERSPSPRLRARVSEELKTSPRLRKEVAAQKQETRRRKEKAIAEEWDREFEKVAGWGWTDDRAVTRRRASPVRVVFVYK